MLNANYVRAGLKDIMSLPFPDHPAMHEALFDDRFLKDTGVTTLDFAKAMIDEGFHPMTVYFPLVVHGAMLIEPTESEVARESRPLHRRAPRPRLRGDGGQAEAFPRSAAFCPAPPPRRDPRRAPAGAEMDPARPLRGGCGIVEPELARLAVSAPGEGHALEPALLTRQANQCHDRSAHLAGIGLMLLATLMFSLNDVLGKWLVATYSVWPDPLSAQRSRRFSCCRPSSARRLGRLPRRAAVPSLQVLRALSSRRPRSPASISPSGICRSPTR